MTQNISNTEDVLDVRDIIEAVEAHHEIDPMESTELTQLLSELVGYGGDHQWRGEWYPVSLIRDSYFEKFAQEYAEELGLVPDDIGWPFGCIDWEKAASELQMDYTSVEFDGITYWYR